VSDACVIRVQIQAEPYDIAAEIEAAKAAGGHVGAVVTFSGVCRDENGRLAALELEHYPGMAEAEIGRIAAEAAGRWAVTSLTVIHRHGKLAPGDDIVLVVSASAHRQAAFDAASFLMDFLKTNAPFWKKEHLADGSSGGWVEAKDADDDAAARW
jgi:molybdopterin synthase catalytic subunit